MVIKEPFVILCGVGLDMYIDVANVFVYKVNKDASL